MKKILIVEDNPAILEVIEEMLDLHGYDIHTAQNGSDGLQLAKSLLPHLIISDVTMPKMDGYSMLEALRADATTALIPFIFLTANAQKQDVLQGAISGADRYLTKPFTAQSLLKSVQEVLVL
ncbi:MAG: response regulator [Bacteroidota bacterium]